MNDFATSLIRTIVPIIVGFLLTQLTRLGVAIDNATLATLVTAVLSGTYYTAVRWLESKVPALGKLLGKQVTPKYN
jgi:hypothetical protein